MRLFKRSDDAAPDVPPSPTRQAAFVQLPCPIVDEVILRDVFGDLYRLTMGQGEHRGQLFCLKMTYHEEQALFEKG